MGDAVQRAALRGVVAGGLLAGLGTDASLSSLWLAA
jgi:hypothetical protein